MNGSNIRKFKVSCCGCEGHVLLYAERVKYQ